MKEIPLTQGKSALVDDEDYHFLMQWKWCFDGRYANRCQYINKNKYQKILMHRVILQTPIGMHTDHSDGNKLNNTRDNLRICTRSENLSNRKRHKNNTSGFKGVYWNKKIKKWQSTIDTNKVTFHLGTFETAYEAHLAYEQAALKYHGEFARFD